MMSSRPYRARYSRWDGAHSVEPLSAEDVLAALRDGLLSEGVDASLTRALYQGLKPDGGPPMPGIDHLRDRLRAEQQSTMNALNAELDQDSLSRAMASSTDASLRRILSALRAGSASIARLLADAPSSTCDKLTAIAETASPAHGTVRIQEQLDRIVELGQLERQIRLLRTVHDVGTLDIDQLERLLGTAAGDAVMRLIGSLATFAESGYVQKRGSRASLSSRAVQQIGETLLQSALTQLRSRADGQHLSRDRGQSHEPTGTSRDYEFGDPFELDLGQTVLGAVKRGAGTPVRIVPSDLKINDRETSERATTILAVDLSRSMGERGYLLAAKKLALALTTFIRTRYPHDELLLIGFSESARRLQLQELIDLKWDRYGFGTNVQEALRLATSTLASHRGRRRNVVLITDGEPTAHRDSQGEVTFSHPPSDETLALTYREARRLRQDGIYLCVCVMSAQRQVTTFGAELARHAAADVIVTEPDQLSADLIVTYSRNRR